MEKEEITTYYNSPTGLLEIKSDGQFITSILFKDDLTEIPTQHSIHPTIKNCIQQFDEYFAGKRKSFDFPMQQSGTTFQQSVWTELQKIPYGETISYLELSKRIGNVKAIRAAGTANGQNELAIVVPCHRVIGSSGKLVGYAGGLERKKYLLLHEADHTIPTKTLF